MLAGEGGLLEDGPGRLGVRVAPPTGPLGIVAHPLAEVHRLCSPCLLKEEIEHDGIVIQALVDESDPAQLASQRVAPCGRQVGVDSVQCAAQVDAIAEVLQGAPHPRFAAKAARPVPHRGDIAEKVQHQHVRVRHCAKERFDARLGPELGLVKEGPSLQNPYRLRVGLGHALIDRPSRRSEEVGLSAGRRHFDEGVCGIEVIGAKQPSLLLEKSGRHAVEQRVQRIQQVSLPLNPADLVQSGAGEARRSRRRHMSREALQHWGHSQRAFPCQDLLLQGLMAGNPGCRQRSAPAIETSHPAKRQERRARQEAAHVLVGESEARGGAGPGGFLARY